MRALASGGRAPGRLATRVPAAAAAGRQAVLVLCGVAAAWPCVRVRGSDTGNRGCCLSIAPIHHHNTSITTQPDACSSPPQHPAPTPRPERELLLWRRCGAAGRCRRGLGQVSWRKAAGKGGGAATTAWRLLHCMPAGVAAVERGPYPRGSPAHNASVRCNLGCRWFKALSLSLSHTHTRARSAISWRTRPPRLLLLPWTLWLPAHVCPLQAVCAQCGPHLQSARGHVRVRSRGWG